MMKPFRAILAEQDQDYEYKLCSVENIHNAEIMAKIRLALGRYGLIDLEKQGIQTTFTNKAAKYQFDEYPFMPVYVCKVTLANPLGSRQAVQSISVFTRIADDKLAFYDKSDSVVVDGADAEQHMHPVEVDSKSAQAEVGDAKVASLVSDLMKDIASGRKASTIERDVYEGVVVSHREIAESTGRQVRRGFYMIERAPGGSIMTGPFSKIPENYEYATRSCLKSIGEGKPLDSGMSEYLVEFDEDQQKDPKDAGTRMRGTAYEAEVVDQDTGKHYTISVRATSSNDARGQAIEQIAAKHGLRKDALIAIKPEPTAGN